jgi:FMN phosphatase YigB (HAD superfamily)
MSKDLLFKAKDLGLFDSKWYENKYSLYFNDELDAFSDYMRKSRHSWVDPSPLFSTRLYHFNNSEDLSATGMSPLEHFLVKGFAAKLDTYTPTAHWIPKDIIKPQPDINVQSRISITAHIFYDDYIDILAECLYGLPFIADLLITASSSDIATRISQRLGNIPNTNLVAVRKVPNKGRNFGPLLVEFGRQLLDYDLVCHLHSKKSLFTGTCQHDWSDYQYEYLLRDKQILMKALSIFKMNSNIGIYYPRPYAKGLPKWASHTLKNKNSIRRLSEMIGTATPKTGFLSYPVGGMFWARPEALKLLLSYDWSYEHFPEEPIPNDGTVLHAIERILPRLANSHGYDDIIYDPTSATYTYDKSFIREEYKNTRGDAYMLAKSDKIKIVSFDIFDTLVFRSCCYPDQGKEDMAVKLGFSDVAEFVALRNNTELEIRKSRMFEGDVSILDIYEKITDSIDFGMNPHYLADLEFQSDLKYILPKSKVLDLMRYADSLGKAVYIISDTYYLPGQLDGLLKSLNIPKYTLFASSVIGKRKDNGTMWQHIRDLLSKQGICSIREFMHIGDNVVSDCQWAGDLNVNSFHILNPYDKWNFEMEHSLTESDFNDLSIRNKFAPSLSLFGSNPFYD